MEIIQNPENKLELMIDGSKLSEMLSDDSRIQEIKEILSFAQAVVIYRASPKQKAQVVQFIRNNNPSKVTLSVGDGANDVNMIQKAHIGIGIMGKEGNQAAAFSDYAIPEFRCLRKLILWHGRQFGVNASSFIMICIFKSLSFSINLSLYNAYAGFSGLQMIDSILWMMYNVCLTNVQMSQCFLFDQDAPMSAAAKTEPKMPQTLKQQANAPNKSYDHPQLNIYEQETLKLGYSLAEYYNFCKTKYQQTILVRILVWELIAIWASLCSYYIPFWSWGLGISDVSGRTEDLFAASLAVYSCNIFMHHF